METMMRGIDQSRNEMEIYLRSTVLSIYAPSASMSSYHESNRGRPPPLPSCSNPVSRPPDLALTHLISTWRHYAPVLSLISLAEPSPTVRKMYEVDASA
jgi:hypothetical protein